MKYLLVIAVLITALACSVGVNAAAVVEDACTAESSAVDFTMDGTDRRSDTTTTMIRCL